MKTELYIAFIALLLLASCQSDSSKKSLEEMAADSAALADQNKTLVVPWEATLNDSTHMMEIKRNPAANMTNLLTEIRELHVIDQDPSYYYGYFSGNIKNSPFGGQADMPGVDAIGMDIDNANLMPHELGHNFGRAHVNCNNPETVDNDYPYDPSIIGSLAVSLGLDKIYGPNSYADLMSYCKPKFVSDYSYIAVQDYIQSKPPKAFAKVVQTLLQKPDLGARRSLFITGQINSSDVVSLRRLVPLNTSPKIIPEGEYQLKVVATDGTEAIYSVELPKVDHPVPQQEQYFSAIIPYSFRTFS